MIEGRVGRESTHHAGRQKQPQRWRDRRAAANASAQRQPNDQADEKRAEQVHTERAERKSQSQQAGS